MIRRATVNDIGSIIKLLPKKVVDNKTKNILKQHMRDGLVFVGEDEGSIVGVSAMLRKDPVSSWTYYYIDEKYRGKKMSMLLFGMSMMFMHKTTVMIKSKELADKSTFDKYITPIGSSKTEYTFQIAEEKIQVLKELLRVEEVEGWTWVV